MTESVLRITIASENKVKDSHESFVSSKKVKKKKKKNKTD